MAADPLLREMRRQLALGRLLPLGPREDGAWLAERAAGWVLGRSVADAVADVRLDRLRVGPAGEDAGAPAPAVVPPPPSALPPGPLRIEATCAAGLERPLPECAHEVRAVLATAARERIGLEVTGVDVHVAGLLESPGDGREASAPAGDPLALVPPPHGDAATGEATGEARVARAVLAVPGVLGLSGALGGPSQALRVIDAPGAATPGGDAPQGEGRETPPERLVRLQLAVAAERRTAAVARQARAAAAEAARAGAPGPVAVTVLVAQLADAGRPA
ncbi:nucleopolyhedrovirus P10 family protein [Streptomyces sp. 6N223]|uniref:nucleopolyhedrovirus P10 family protein n=1 Tax=Streptomyces sp. 6N223 TaxID=3457412 RepID=UPI003FCFBA8F